jgi:hypothetical protein
MSASPCLRLFQRLRFEITRDAKIPYWADDPNMDEGWRCIQIRPTADPRWFICDSGRDYKTVWAIPVDDEEGGA